MATEETKRDEEVKWAPKEGEPFLVLWDSHSKFSSGWAIVLKKGDEIDEIWSSSPRPDNIEGLLMSPLCPRQDLIQIGMVQAKLAMEECQAIIKKDYPSLAENVLGHHLNHLKMALRMIQGEV